VLHIGCHLSCSKGYTAMGAEAAELAADTFAFFTRNPRGGAAKTLDPDDVAAFLSRYRSGNNVQSIIPLVAHAPYTLNPCAADAGLRDYAYRTMLDDLHRLAYTPGNYYNFHPGSHVQQGADTGMHLTADLLGRAAAASTTIRTPGGADGAADTGAGADAAVKESGGGNTVGCRPLTVILVETMSGKGSEIGRTFEEVHEILSRAEAVYAAQTAGTAFEIPFNQTTGVCLDTCHVWDGGYDIVNDLDGVLTKFDKTVGLPLLRAVHLNDSMNGLGSHKDRHQKIGQGAIGLEALCRVINHPALRGLPFILETPNEHDGYKAEIALLRSRFIE